MRHSLCTDAGERSASSHLEFDTTFVRSVPAQTGEESLFAGPESAARRAHRDRVGLGGLALLALIGLTVGGFRQSSSVTADPTAGLPRNSFHAAESSAPKLDATQRIQACIAGEGTVCNALGVEIIQHEGFSGPNLQAARVSFDRACNAGNPIGCNNLGVVYENTRSEFGEDLDAKAAKLFRKACDGSSGDGCSNLGVMYENGWGIPQSLTRAREMYLRACDSGNALGCSNLGALYAEGRGVPKDLPRAQGLFDRACSGNSEVGCHNLAVV
ncbi:MAG TPA: tetratricopeptide repeat protein, partial [Polyangiaceae bacterium]|nr:tetratricopeptide repeat protein [Polyangiaceae bacterium]